MEDKLKQDIKEYLEENLKITADLICEEYCDTIKVVLYLENKAISTDFVTF